MRFLSTNRLADSLLAALAILVASANANEYQHASGFRITFAENWQPMIRSKPAEFETWLQRQTPAVATLIRENIANAPRLPVMAFHAVPDQSEDLFIENMNVTIIPVQVTFNNANARRQGEELRRELSKTGFTVPFLSAELVQLDKNKAFRIVYRSTRKDLGFELTGTQYYFSKNGKSYVVTFTCLTEEYPQFEPIFAQMAQSIEIPGSNKSLASSVIKGAAVGGVIGLSVGFILWVLKAAFGIHLLKNLEKKKQLKSPNDS